MTSDRPLTGKGDLQTFCQRFEVTESPFDPLPGGREACVGAETRVTEGAEGPAGGDQGVWAPGSALTLCAGG